ncbi:hypothetical protein CCE29_02100 [Lacticaseibacillus rhamnosus]|nr:hypothetical protein B4583_02675 [Lacticaseibacillus rhamnosus]AXI93923.1 hypothetical protein DU507_05125 [Lacticaseibacillus rhamnosus GG]ART94873.1 hypothetical protein CCE29_02100 [Lacticaseibacillus rhamnosus]AZZ22597.1 hypothetical protein CYG41_05115 [Lacticaseibacillus rhamnosus]OAU07072.1 hypothetical protein PY83_07030 [Lacticaseibacillus rhamnosus]
MEQHSDRALSLMLLGDLETAGLAGSKRRHSVPALSGRRLRSLARPGTIFLTYPPQYSDFNQHQILK